MKKKIIMLAFPALLAMFSLNSCVTINSGAALAEKAPVGPKMGETKSTIILGLWSAKGKENNLEKAAKNGGISKVSQVEYVDQSVFFGLVIKHITRVYGE